MAAQFLLEAIQIIIICFVVLICASVLYTPDPEVKTEPDPGPEEEEIEINEAV
jgi:hypothetical protein